MNTDYSTILNKFDKPKSISSLLQASSFTNCKSLSNQIVVEISQLIESLQIRPGELISENEIAKALSISKTPVREALIRLEELEFVNIVPRVGSYVTPINIDRYIEACFVRLQLETGAVGTAALKSTQANKEALFLPLLEEQKRALENSASQDFYNLDQRLHLMFFEVAELPGVWKTVKRSQTDVNRIRHLKRMFNISRAAQVIHEHSAIVEAICRGDQNAARKALVTHIGSLDKEIETLSAHPELLDYIETLNAAQPRRRDRQALMRTTHARQRLEK